MVIMKLMMMMIMPTTTTTMKTGLPGHRVIGPMDLTQQDPLTHSDPAAEQHFESCRHYIKKKEVRHAKNAGRVYSFIRRAV